MLRSFLATDVFTIKPNQHETSLYDKLPDSLGESLQVLMHIHLPGGKVHECVIPLETSDGNLWKGDFVYTHPTALWFEYCYAVCADEKRLRQEWKHARRQVRADMNGEYFFPDIWMAVPACSHLYSDAFGQVAQKDCEANVILHCFSNARSCSALKFHSSKTMSSGNNRQHSCSR